MSGFNLSKSPSSGSATPSILTQQIPSVTSQSSPKFNRRPLSDTPVDSRTNSPHGPQVSSAFGSADNLKSTANSSNASVPALSISTPNNHNHNILNLQSSLSLSSSSESSSTTSSTNSSSSSISHLQRHPNSHGDLSPIVSGDSAADTTGSLVTPSPSVTPRSHRRATTLNVPGLTRSRVSPSGHISQLDIGSKLVIVMVGLPARGKSYLTNKLCRYLNWLQHDARIFNVGNTRRKASKTAGPAHQPLPDNPDPTANSSLAAVMAATSGRHPQGAISNTGKDGNIASSGQNSVPSPKSNPLTESNVPNTASSTSTTKPNNEPKKEQGPDSKKPTEQTADFFSPDNAESVRLREQWALDTLNDLLDYVIDGPGSIGILDATNTTISRRKKVLERIKERSDGLLRVLFVESICSDSRIIEKNIRLKLSGPDYKDSDSEVALRDFIERMRNYEKVYQTLTEDEAESDSFQYVKMIDVGKKINTYNIKGFLAPDVVAFLLNFNLAERQIWITRHGESVDNAAGRIGGDSKLTPRGRRFSKALAKFMDYQKKEFRKNQLARHAENTQFLQNTNKLDPASPILHDDGKIPEEPNFCVWTSMLRRSFESAAYFNEDVFDIKEMRMLNELGAGICDGMTYPEIKSTYPHEYQARIADKLSYRYPGPGGESYLDVINRIRSVLVEVERMTDNVMIIAHRVVCRILLAYFMNLGRDAIGDLDVPLHTLYCLEPKPYGVGWEVYEYDDKKDWFYRIPKETLLERNRRPSAAPKLAGRTRQFSVAPTDFVSDTGLCTDSSSLNHLPPVFSADSSPLMPSPNTNTIPTPSASFSIGSTLIRRPPSSSPSPTSTSAASASSAANARTSGAPGFAAQRGIGASPILGHSNSSQPNSSSHGSSISSSSSTATATTVAAVAATADNASDKRGVPENVTLPHTPYSTLPTIGELSARLNNLTNSSSSPP